jgi:hypothetical protein
MEATGETIILHISSCYFWTELISSDAIVKYVTCDRHFILFHLAMKQSTKSELAPSHNFLDATPMTIAVRSLNAAPAGTARKKTMQRSGNAARRPSDAHRNPKPSDRICAEMKDISKL